MAKYRRVFFVVLFTTLLLISLFLYYNSSKTGPLSIKAISNTSNLSSFPLHDDNKAQQSLPDTKHVSKHVPVKYSEITANFPSVVENQWIDINNGITLVRRTVFYDIRPQFERSIVIVILHNHEKQKKVPRLHALVIMSSKETFCAQVKHWKQTGGVQRNWHEVTLNHVLRISIVNDSQPESIQLSKEAGCNKDSLWPVMPVFFDKREKRDKTFATCLQKSLFNKVSPGDVVNFIELNRALGASIITIFLSNRLEKSDKIYKAIEPYIKTGLVEVLGWTLKDGWPNGMYELGMSGCATECVYRNMNRAKYMTLHDVDEFIIPSEHLTWAGMIDELKKTYDLNKFASLQFANAFFKETVEPGPTTKCKVPVYFTRFLRSSDPERVHPKVIVDLDTTITAYCHDVKNWKDGINKELKVSTKIGNSFHYRNSLGHRIKYVKKWIHDTTVNRYIHDIIPSIEKHSCVTE